MFGVIRRTSLELGISNFGDPVGMTNDGSRIKLSPREREILALACLEGLQYKEIAERLHISPNTVAARICDIHAWLGISSRGVLCVWVLQRPQVLDGQWVDKPLHKQGCNCRGPLCRMTRGPKLKPAA